MLVIKHNKKYKRKYTYGGSGIFDAITSIVTSNAAQEVGKHIAKTAGSKLVNKVIDKAFTSKKRSPQSQALINQMLKK